MKKIQDELEGIIEYLENGSVKRDRAISEECESGVRQPVFSYKYIFEKGEKLEVPAMQDYFVIFFVQKGTVNITLGSDSQDVVAGKGAGITSNTGFILTQVGNGETEMDIFIFSLTAIFSQEMTVLSARYETPFYNIDSHQFNVFNSSLEVGAEIYKLVMSIMQYNNEKPYGYELMVRARMCELWYIIVRAFTKVTPVREIKSMRKDEQRVKLALDYIKANYREQITLDEIAKELNICKSECCRCFKRVLGLTPIEYVVRYRIYTAAFLLDEPGQKRNDIAEIAVKVGFNNISYFNKMFKKYIGMTPSEYRQNLTNDERIDRLRGRRTTL